MGLERASSEQIAALEPTRDGHQFVFYGDACSGIAGAAHEAGLARTNACIARLDQQPDFVIFAGDEVAGLTSNEAELRAQWRYWLDVEMRWLDRSAVPLYNTTSNHTTYNAMSERVFVDELSHLPRNGPVDQLGLSYFVRRSDLLLVFVNTNWSGLGGEGHVETEWLATTLEDHAERSVQACRWAPSGVPRQWVFGRVPARSWLGQWSTVLAAVGAPQRVRISL